MNIATEPMAAYATDEPHQYTPTFSCCDEVTLRSEPYGFGDRCMVLLGRRKGGVWHKLAIVRSDDATDAPRITIPDAEPRS